MYRIIGQAIEATGSEAGLAGMDYNRLVVMGGAAGLILVFLVLLFCYLFYRKRAEHRQVMAAVERGMEPGKLGIGKVSGLAWITSLTVGLALLIIGIGVMVWGELARIYMLVGIILSGVGISLLLYGILRRAAEHRSWAIEKGVALSEIERPSPIMSFWLGAGLLVLFGPLYILMQNSGWVQRSENERTALLFGICLAACLAAGGGLLVRGCLLRKAERRYLSKEKGIHFSGRRRSKITKSILLGIGFLLVSLYFLYIVIEEYRRGNRDQEWQLLFFAVPFTLGVVFFVRAALVRRRRGRRGAASAEVDNSGGSAG